MNPFPLVFEELLQFFNVPDGQVTIFEGPAPAPFPDGTPTPFSSIRTDQAWGVRCQWTTQGPLNFLMAGNWELTLFLEQMGGGEFAGPAGNTRTIPFVSAPHAYSEDMVFGANSVPAGAYRFVKSVTLIGPGGFRGPIAAVGDGPIVQFYDVG